MNKKQVSTKVQEIATINEVKNIAKDVVINHKPTTNVKEVVVNELQATKKEVVQNVTAKTKTLAFRVGLLQNECDTISGKAFLNAANLKKEDVNVPNVLKCFTSIIVNGKPHFCKVIKLKDENLMTFATLETALGAKVETVDFKFSILDKNYLTSTLNDKILIIKGDAKFTLQIVETLNFNQVLSKLASYKKEQQFQAAKAIQLDIAEKAKAEKELLHVKTPEQKEAEILKLKEKLAKLENVA